MSEHFLTQQWIRGRALWIRLTEPPPSVRGDEMRRQARWQASLLLSMVIGTLILTVVPALFFDRTLADRNANIIATGVGFVVLLALYALSRHGHYTLTNVLALSYGISAIILVSALMGEPFGVRGLYYLLIATIFASLFLSLRISLLLLAVQSVGMFAGALAGRLPAADIMNGPFQTDLFLGLSILVMAHHWKQLQAERKARLDESLRRDRVISGIISDYAFSFWVKADNTLELDWITDDSFQRVTGYNRDDVRAQGGLFAFDHDDQMLLAQEWQQTIQGEPSSGEHRLVTRDGDIRWLRIDRYPVWNETHTRVVRVYGVAKDITERKEAELALRKSEERYRAITELMSDYAFSYYINPDGSLKLNWVTEEPFTRATGYTAADLHNGGMFAFHPDDMSAAQVIREQTRNGKVSESELRIQTKDGHTRWVYFRRHPVWNEKEQRYDMYYGVAKDITERKKAELALRESEERYRVISEMMSDYAFSFRLAPDNSLTLEWVTDSISHVTGFTPAEIATRLEDSPFSIYHPEDAQRVQADMGRVLANETVEAEYRIVDKQGDVRWIQMNRRPIWDEAEGRVVRFYGVAKDVTARKQAEAAQRESDERYRAIAELMSDYAFSCWVEPDGELRLDWITDSALQNVLGYTEADIRERGVFAGFASSEVDAARAGWQRTIEGEKTEAEHEAVTKTGETRWIHSYRYPVWDEAQGRVVRIYGVVKDITARKQAEIALRESEERYRAISELISDYAYSCRTNEDGTLPFEWVTGSVTRVTGYTADEMRALRSFQYYHPEDVAQARADVEQVANNIPVGNEYRILTKDGQTRWVWVYRRPVWDEAQGRVVRFYGGVQDITERKRAEKALQESEERYRIISDMISDYAFSVRVEPDGSLTPEWMTDSVKRMMGYTAEEVLTAKPQYSLYHPDDEALARTDVAKVLRGIPTETEYRSITKSGELRWQRMYRLPIWDEQKQRVIRFYGVVQDITHRKQVENQQLRLALERERLMMVNQFVEAFSHDVRTSLATIETSRYLIERMTTEITNAHLPVQLHKIHYSVNHLSEQLDNLHMVSSLADPNLVECQLNRMIESLVADHSLRAQQKRLTLTFEADSSLPMIAVDESKIQQAVQHLLINALVHTEDGGAIMLRTCHNDQYAIIEVEDSGAGISPEQLSHIFEPFYKADLSRKLADGGMGLGLSIVNMIVQAHNGRIMVESEAGQGSLFTIELPLLSQTEHLIHQPV